MNNWDVSLITKKPSWLNKKINFTDCNRLKELLGNLNLNTVCQEAGCPNIGECFALGQATFLILGKFCTRGCRFCGLEKGEPEDVDLDEPRRVAEAVRRLNLSHVVITSVTRDDLADGGANFFIKTISSVRKEKPGIIIEVLIPDFQLNRIAIKKLVDAQPNIIAHNIETIPRLYNYARRGADYIRSLEVLRLVKEYNSCIFTKSGIMLGLGEREDEVLDAFADLVKVGCEFLSIGQYLSPSPAHVAVEEYISPEKFSYYKQKAVEAGFKHVLSAPYVRSSYLASEYLS